MARTEGKSCLVVGGGFIGGHVARRLADCGHAVAVFSRGVNPWLAERAQGIELHRGIVEEDGPALAELVAEAEVVLQFASSSKAPSASASPVGDVSATITPALHVMQALADAGARRTLVVVSSGGTVYGSPDVLPTPESHPLRPSTPYAISHVAVEQYAAYFERRHGISTIVARLGNVYGPGELGRAGQGVVGTWLACAARGEPGRLAGNLTTARDYVYAEDAADAVRLLVEKSSGGTYNVGSSHATPLEDVLAAVVQITGVPLELTADAAQHPTAHVPRTQLDCSKLRLETGWQPQVAFGDGVERTWEWTAARLAFEKQFSTPSHT